ncbi:MAG: hypothetical protein FWH18_06975 [Marinilabiliaceae bacterium]|nr:hypothetical protein [Marinilabiliaceae bacterium]
MTAQEARDHVKKNDAKLQIMYDVAPFAEEDPNPNTELIARGFSTFKDYIGSREEILKECILQV